MNKIWIILAIALIFVGGIFLLSAPEIGDKTPYDTVNDFPEASIKIVEVSQEEKKITVEYAYTGETELVYGAYHRFEIFEEDGWHTLMPKSKNLTYPDIGYVVKSGQTGQKTYGWAGLGRLPKGRYRFVQEVSEEVEDARNTPYVLAVEFDIE